MKKLLPILLVLVLTVGIMGAAFASAADLEVRGGTIQAGLDEDLALFEDVQVREWILGRDCASVVGVRMHLMGATEVDFVNEDQWFTVHVCITNNGTVIREGSMTLSKHNLTPTATGWWYPDVVVNFARVPACQITDIHIVIEGSVNSGPTWVCPTPT